MKCISRAASITADKNPEQTAVGAGNTSIGVGQQRKWQPVLAGKIGMRTCVIDADPDHDRVEFPQRADVVAETTGFTGATRRVVTRVEIQHQPATGIVAQTVHLTILVLQGEVRRHAALRALRARSQYPENPTCCQ